MQIVIDIQEDVFARLFDNGIEDNEISVDDVCEMARAIRLGTPESEVLIKMKKDLKGRQKKIEKLISSDVRHACEAEHFKDLYILECKKNCALFLRYKDVNKELALLKNSKEESEVK